VSRYGDDVCERIRIRTRLLTGNDIRAHVLWQMRIHIRWRVIAWVWDSTWEQVHVRVLEINNG